MSGIFKQLVINSLVNSKELQEEIKSFIFVEQKQITKKIKDAMISDMNLNLKYWRASESWGLAYCIWKKTIGGLMHNGCGNYCYLYSEEKIPKCVKCKCPEMQIIIGEMIIT